MSVHEWQSCNYVSITPYVLEKITETRYYLEICNRVAGMVVEGMCMRHPVHAMIMVMTGLRILKRQNGK